MTSLVYRHPRLYRWVLRALYGRALKERERAVASWVPTGARVIDVCCGDGGIRRALPGRTYVGVDASPRFVQALAKAGVEAHLVDVSRDDPPQGDVVLVLGSLYQFLPDPDPVLRRLARAAREALVVAEPYRNLAQSKVPLVAALARRATDPGVPSSTSRFDEASLRACLRRHGAQEILRTGRELVARLPGQASRGGAT